MMIPGNQAVAMCKIGKGVECCAFVIMGAMGFECSRDTPYAELIKQRLLEGTMNAKGQGGWEGCIWGEKK